MDGGVDAYVEEKVMSPRLEKRWFVWTLMKVLARALALAVANYMFGQNQRGGHTHRNRMTPSSSSRRCRRRWRGGACRVVLQDSELSIITACCPIVGTVRHLINLKMPFLRTHGNTQDSRNKSGFWTSNPVQVGQRRLWGTLLADLL